MIGAHLGQYLVTGELGRGGMGEVWRAEDTRLGREVALKVLPPGFADDPDRIARFEREARVLASLNHPNIATLYGLETAAPSSASSPSSSSSSSSSPDAGRAACSFLVMELVEGEGLDELISRGAIPIGEALPLALQIAEALEAAHEAGIVHRDLKPANVRVRPDGAAKVLDFGLAKAWKSEGSGTSDLSLSPTMTRHGTAAGIILGTAAYMSPEQARGKPVDRRADIWASGVVLWEMLTGCQLFRGDTVSDVLAAVLRETPDLASLPPATPAAIRQLVRRCLERQPRDRLRDNGDARIVLQETLSGADDDGTPASEAPSAASTSSSRARWLWPIGLVAAAAAAATLATLADRCPRPRRRHRAVGGSTAASSAATSQPGTCSMPKGIACSRSPSTPPRRPSPVRRWP
jgi:serine/threonine-protein kinase